MDDAPKAAQFFREKVMQREDFDPMREHLVIITLDTKLRATGYSIISIGGLNECLAHPREIFRAAILAAAYSFVLVHNHPSGDPQPSPQDLILTKKIREGAALLAISFMDHLIIGTQELLEPWQKGFFSFRDAAIL